ncbi:hypothetical protein LZ575_17520 [Antarcticibacterium sp. 1MA-6-2]|uniref:hypothetical protein n=1 Tax=Antarcticibacterium sp. 1MA-6-2 TaxID=2908210 RepID=UPI001F489798|nr:hypothetical protein [Antarcticibacterium sp. 1MA-6-2]UJH90565.1 hypothetical protein LZ575_17520 [Antarcticibacterium sp. 1MA-6-2]
MEKLINQLMQKMDMILENQQIILNRLDQSIIYPQYKEKPAKPKAQTKKEEEREAIERYKLLLIHGPKIREKFNLVAAPQSNRILAYLKTGDPVIFDGLKRRK